MGNFTYSEHAALQYAFGSFVVDPLRRDLLHSDGMPVRITPRLINALLLFVEHPCELLDKDWLMGRLWPGLVVEENNLSQVISGLRRTLGCDGRCYIRTETRRGFRFVCPVTVLGMVPDQQVPRSFIKATLGRT